MFVIRTRILRGFFVVVFLSNKENLSKKLR